MKFKSAKGDRIFYVIIYLIATVAVVVTLYPFIYIISVSLSDAQAVLKGEVFFFPIGFSIGGYKQVLEQKGLWQSYGNTILYTVVGTACNMIATCVAAYPLSRRKMIGNRFFNFFIVFTMYFSGGLIPTYLNINALGLYNSRWVMIIPGLISSYNMMICRSAFATIPEELIESAEIDGANEFKIFSAIAVRLIKPTLAVLLLYYAVGHWNNFFTALLYLSDQTKMPLQVLLRRVLIQSSSELLQGVNMVNEEAAATSLQVRYVTIIVATLPIMALYPFIQKYFVKGVMVGAIKG